MAQLVLLLIGLIVWGYGQRVEDSQLTGIGLIVFAVATVLRLAGRKKEDRTE
jgi:hypothetical protein